VREIDTKLSGSAPGQDNGGGFGSGCSVSQQRPKTAQFGGLLLALGGLSLLTMRRFRRLSR